MSVLVIVPRDVRLHGVTWVVEEGGKGGEIGGGAKGNRRRITKESDWRRKEVKTKGRMYAFFDKWGMGEEGSRHWRGRIRVGRYLPPRDTVLKRCRAAPGVSARADNLPAFAYL